jgi:2-dehydropantoate 2-reductase
VNILVYGAGAVGGFWGGLLLRAGHDVRFVARGAQLAALTSRGLRIVSDELGEIAVTPVRALSHASGTECAELVLVAVKAHQTEAVLDDLSTVVGDETTVIPLQNGIEADDVLRAKCGDRRVLSAVVYVGASVESPGVVRHVARGLLMVGNPYGVADARYRAALNVLAAPGLQVRAVENIHRERWYKLMWNASFNAVSALTLQASHPLLEEPRSRAVIEGAMREVAAVARTQGIRLLDGDVDASIAETKKLPPIRTSMLDDRERGREMEVEALVGVVVRLGGEAGVPTPVMTTLYGLLKAVRLGAPGGFSPLSSQH